MREQSPAGRPGGRVALESGPGGASQVGPGCLPGCGGHRSGVAAPRQGCAYPIEECCSCCVWSRICTAARCGRPPAGRPGGARRTRGRSHGLGARLGWGWCWKGVEAGRRRLFAPPLSGGRSSCACAMPVPSLVHGAGHPLLLFRELSVSRRPGPGGWWTALHVRVETGTKTATGRRSAPDAPRYARIMSVYSGTF